MNTVPPESIGRDRVSLPPAHLAATDFALRVAAGFECLKDTPVHDSWKAAVAQVAITREWVRKKVAVEQPAMNPKLPSVGTGLPLSRKERLGYEYANAPEITALPNGFASKEAYAAPAGFGLGSIVEAPSTASFWFANVTASSPRNCVITEQAVRLGPYGVLALLLFPQVP